MSIKRGLFSLGVGLCLVLFASLAWSGDWVEVKGRGYSADRVPPVTDDPPPSWTEDSDEHDPDEGETYNGPNTFDLRQGPDRDNKSRWGSSNYVHWQVFGATLLAKGRIHDADPANASTVTSEAWGLHEITVSVSRAEGEYGYIRAENKILFEWDYYISGGSIGEAGVQLMGNAYDIKGRHHRYSLSDQRGEGIEKREERTSGTSRSEYGRLRVSLGSRNGKTSASVGGEAGSSQEAHDSLNVTINRRLPKADGDSGSTPAVEIEENIGGRTPISRDYVVTSDGAVTLRARQAAGAGDGSGPVVVALRRFKVQNNLRAWKKASDEPWTPPDPPTIEPPGPPPPSRSQTKPEYPPMREADPYFERSYGLEGEPGSLPGVLGIRLREPAPAQTVLEVVPLLPDVILLPEDARIVIDEGERFGSLFFHGAQVGETTVALRLLGADGAPTGEELLLDVATSSILSQPQTRIWADVPGRTFRPGEGLTVRALRGEDVGPLRIGRLGYADIATEATTVQIAVDDPAGVLPQLPASVTIPAGAVSTEVPLALADTEGTATIRLTAGEETIEVTVVSRSQSWRSVPIRVPAGATAQLPWIVEHPQRAARGVTAVAADPSRLVLEDDDGRSTLQPGERAWYFPVRGALPGATTVTLASEGLPDLDVPVEVVPAWIEMEAGSLRLTGLLAGTEGVVRLTAPEGMTIESIELPPDAADYLAVEGLGTSQATLVFTPGPDLPATLSLPILFGGSASAEPPLRLSVFETLTEPGPEGARNAFEILVR